MVLSFTKNPSSKSLRPLVELYGRDRERMKVEAEMLARQLEYRLPHFAKPDDAAVRKLILKVLMSVRLCRRSARRQR